MLFLLAASIVTLGLAAVLPDNKVITNIANEHGKIQQDFFNFFESIGENDPKRKETYRSILEGETRREQQAFDSMKDEWRSARFQSGKQRQSHTALKREAEKTSAKMPDDKEEVGVQVHSHEMRDEMKDFDELKTADQIRAAVRPVVRAKIQERKKSEMLMKENIALKKDLGIIVHQFKELACALTFRFAVETFNDRFNIDNKFSVTTVEVIIQKLRAKIDERKKTLLRIVELLSHASVQNKHQAEKKVLHTWLHLMQDFSVDESAEHEAELAKAFLRIKNAADEKEVLRVWHEDSGNFWRLRIAYRKVPLVSSTIPSTKRKRSTRVSPKTVSLTDEQNTGTKTSELDTNQSTSPSKAQRLYKLQQEFHLLAVDDVVINDLSNLSSGLVKELIEEWKYSGTAAAVYIRNIVELLPQMGSVSKQYLTCSWILFTHEYHTGIEPLIEFLSSKWEGQKWSVKVNRFCSRFDLVFWRLPSNKRVHPKLKLPPNFKLEKADYDNYLAEFGTGDTDARIVGEALLIHFNVNYQSD